MVSREILQNQLKKFKIAITRLEEACKKEKDEFIRDSVIKRFEFSFELLWKTVKKLAKYENIDCDSPRFCIKTAYQLGLISNEETFLSMLEYRNLSTHL